MTETPAWADLLVPDWSARVPESPIAGLSLDVWRWRASASSPNGDALCAADEQSAASLPPTRRNGFLSRRAVLRRILARYLDCFREPRMVVSQYLAPSGVAHLNTIAQGGA